MELNFNAAEVPDQAFALLPATWYVAAIEDIEKKDNKKGTGWYLSLKIKIDENRHPEVGGRVIYSILTMEHSESPTAVAIGQSQLKKICAAVGKPDGVKDSDELLYRPIAVKVKIKPETPEYPAKNEVADYDAVANRFGTPGTPPASPAPATATASPAPAGAKPWMRK